MKTYSDMTKEEKELILLRTLVDNNTKWLEEYIREVDSELSEAIVALTKRVEELELKDGATYQDEQDLGIVHYQIKYCDYDSFVEEFIKTEKDRKRAELIFTEDVSPSAPYFYATVDTDEDRVVFMYGDRRDTLYKYVPYEPKVNEPEEEMIPKAILVNIKNIIEEVKNQHNATHTNEEGEYINAYRANKDDEEDEYINAYHKGYGRGLSMAKFIVKLFLDE